MMNTSTGMQRHLAYSEWASRRLLEGARALPPDELTRDFGSADKSILGTLVHVMAADRIWLSRVQGAGPGPFLEDSDFSLEALAERWPGVWSGWQSVLEKADGSRVVAYTDTKGRQYSNLLGDIVLHVVNHATHHRGQVAGFLRALGHRPPATDLTAMLRE